MYENYANVRKDLLSRKFCVMMSVKPQLEGQ